MCVQEEPTVVQQQQKKSTFGKKLGLIGGFGKKSKRQPNSDYVHTETGTFATDGAPEYNHSQPSRPKPQPVLETPLEEELWYYGEVSRKDAEQLLRKDGDYLIRYSKDKGPVLTMKWEGLAKHFYSSEDRR